MAQLQFIKHQRGYLIPATPETSEFLQLKLKAGAWLTAEFKQSRNPAHQRKFFSLLNLGFEYWQPTGSAISSNERRLVRGPANGLRHMKTDSITPLGKPWMTCADKWRKHSEVLRYWDRRITKIWGETGPITIGETV